jgi:molecular chaperone GrpE
MSGNRSHEDELFDDLQEDEERLAAEEQAEFDAIEADRKREDPPEDPMERMHRMVTELQAEVDGNKDKMLRTVAEMENLRRRTAKEVIDAKTYSTANFARDMLSVSDNLRRAIEAVPEEAKAAGDKGFLALIEGVEMTERSMLSTLEKNGVIKLSPKNEKFDPNFHQAMFEVPNPDVPNNTVCEVIQDGYVIGKRVLRPAMVGVAKGGPKISLVKPEDDAAASSDEAESTS